MRTKKPLQVKVLINYPTCKHLRRRNWRSLSYKSSWAWLACDDYHGKWQAKQSKSGDIPTRHGCRMQRPLTKGLPTSHWGRGFETSQSLPTQVYKNVYKWTVQDNGVDRTPHMALWEKRCVAFNITEDDLAPLLSYNTCIELGLVYVYALTLAILTKPSVESTTKCLQCDPTFTSKEVHRCRRQRWFLTETSWHWVQLQNYVQYTIWAVPMEPDTIWHLFSAWSVATHHARICGGSGRSGSDSRWLRDCRIWQ